MNLPSATEKMEGITLEKYIILHKIEKAKALIMEDELSLSEIAFMMGYSSSQYLSTQFKSIVGISVTDFKKDPEKYRVALEELGNNE
jgi:AraC-like DNA-binding protein